MGHDIAHGAVAEIEHGAQHRLFGRRGLVGEVCAMQLDGAAQQVAMFFCVVRAIGAHVHQAEEKARDPRDAARQRPEDRHGEQNGRRERERHPVGTQQRPRLGHDLGEDHDHHADRQGRIDDAGGPEEGGQHRRRERGREDIDHVVAEQDGAHRLVLAVEKPVDHGRPLVALLGEPMHAGPRGAGDCRLRCRKVSGQQQAEKDQRDCDRQRQVEMELRVHRRALGRDGVVEQAA